jgi:hypothetical protein
MDIDALSDQTQSTYAFNARDEDTRWNGRNIRESEMVNLSVVTDFFSIKHELRRSLTQCKIQREFTMSRPPDESEASLSAGYDENRGAFIEGKWTWTWNDNNGKESLSDGNQGTAPSDPPDSGDRDFDNDASNE